MLITSTITTLETPQVRELQLSGLREEKGHWKNVIQILYWICLLRKLD